MECCAEHLRYAEDEVITLARAAAIAFAITALPASAENGLDVAWGPAANGLRVAISATAHPERHRGVALELQLENATDGPLRIPGRLRLPWNWHFEFEPELGGSTLVAHFAPPPEPPESPLPIELVSGERFMLQFNCRHWLYRDSHTIARPRPGIHLVQANSVAVGAEPDPKAWTGMVRSGRVQVEISFRDQQTPPSESEFEPEEDGE
ncbi:MAG: hypothetical protein JRE13_01145 [Deltaproteobacteria bacterium]|nr:hypothetical protein [Deltaproteobacteria bacterium]